MMTCVWNSQVQNLDMLPQSQRRKKTVESNVSKTLDFSEMSPHAKASTHNEPNYESLRKLADVKKEQIKKANAFLKLSKQPKYASSVLATLHSMGLVKVKPTEQKNDVTNIFFRLFVESHPEFAEIPMEQCHTALQNKLILFIRTHELQFTRVHFQFM